MKTLFGFFQRRSGLPFLATAALMALTSATSWGQTNPSLFNLGTGHYSLTSWASTSPAASYPANIVFHRTGTQDPGLAVATTTDYTAAYNGTSGARINGLDADGFSFVNTGSGGNLGAAVLGLNTTGRQNIVVGWTGGLVAQADTGRVYAIRLQYRVGTGGTWTDVSPTSEYSSSGPTAGHSSSLTATLPAECNDQASVYVRWKYHSASGSSGTRPRLRVDEISVSSSTAAAPTITAGTIGALSTTYGTASAAQTVSVSGSSLTADITATAPSGFEVSSNGTTFSSTASFTQSGGTANGTLSVRLANTAAVSGTYNSQNIALTSSGATAVNVTTPATGNSVTPAPLTITANNVTKAFGTSLNTVTGSTAFTSNGLVNGETIGSVTITYGTGAAAADPADTYNGSVVPSAATGGTFTASNYAITYTAGNLTVSGSPVIVVDGTISAFSATYGTASAASSFDVSGGNLTGNLTVTAPAGFEVSTTAGAGFGATVTLVPATGTLATTPVFVRLAATTAAGSHAGNVTVAGGGATTQNVAIPASTVAPKELTITGLSGVNKEYDRTPSATLAGTAAYNGLENGDTFAVAGTPVATFANAAIGTAKAISVTGFEAPSANYAVSQPTGLTADITAKALTLSGAAVTAKPYDGTTAATITGTLDGIIAPDAVTLNGTGTFASAEIGTGIAVTANVTLGGADAGNYTLVQPTGLAGDILKGEQTISFTAPGTKNLGDPNFDLVATATSGLPVSFASSNEAVATVSGATVTIVGLGTTDITASQAGNANYNAAPNVVRTLTVSSGPTTLAAGDIAIIGYNTSGSPDSFTILVLKDLNPGTVFYVNDNEVSADGGTSFTDLSEGEASFTVKAGQSIPAGTVITLPWGGAAVSAATYDYSSTSGFGLGNNNEELYLYTASALTATTPTAFIFFAKIGTSPSSRPAGLNAGTTFISPTGTASRYKISSATYSGSPATLLAAIGNTAANWEAVAPAATSDWTFTVITPVAVLLVTEVNSNAAGDDFWELTNVGTASADLSNWKWDDDSANPNDAAAVTIPAETTIAPGQSIVFAVNATSFNTAWGPLTGVTIIGGGPGLGQNDAINLFNASGTNVLTFSYAAGGFTKSDGSASSGGHAGVSAGGTATQSAILDPAFGTGAGRRYTAATAGVNGAVANASGGLNVGSPGVTVGNSTVSIADASVTEGDSGTTTLTLNVTRSATSTAFTVGYAVTGGDATSGTDYVALPSGTLTFTAGGEASQPIQITVNGDTAFEANETIVVTLSNIVNTTGTTVISGAVGTGTITNDDVIAPSFTTHPASTTIASGSSATLSAAASGFPVPTFQWYAGTSGDTANPVSGATASSFTTPALTATASYWVRATNSVGSADSTTATVTVGAAVTGVNLANYVRVGRYDLPEPTRTALPAGTPTHNFLCQEASAVTYNWDTDTLFITGDGGRSITQVSKTGQLIDTMTLALGSSPQGTDFYDPEGLTYIGNGQFVMSEERDRQLVRFTYAAGTTLSRSGAKTVKLGTFVDNIGIEGLSWDPQTNGFICVKEITPIGIFQTNVDFDAGTATNGSPTAVNSTDLFNPALLGMTDVADVFALSNLPGTNGQAQAGNLLVLSQEDGSIVNIDRSGNIASSLLIRSDAGNTLSVAGQQHEGLTMDRSGYLYVVNENGGGGIDYPQLWVYAPATAPNAAPTQLAVNGAITSLPENTSTVSRVSLGDIVVVDDGLGTHTLAVTGTDAAAFEIVGAKLFLKAGTPLDFETKTSYSITLTADDPTVGTTPDVTATFTLAITDIVAESAPAPAIIISEVAPWSSGNSPVVAADWFEVTNTTTSAIDITGWKVDDNSNSFASSVALSGITSIAPGESVIFLESSASNPASSVVANFKAVWFGANLPAGLQVGTYQGSGVGFGTGGDAVNLYDSNGVLQANVTFGSSPSSAPYATFDNTAGVNNGAVTQLSVAGARGAFFATNGAEVGSPGYAQPAVLVVSEIAPWSSGNSPVQADWFEVTNIGGRVINIEGWKVDDSSESPAAAVSLTGINSIAPGESVIFLESSTPATTIATFRSTWNAPASLQIGSYSGSGIGLSTGSDAVNLYDTANARRANIAFGASPTAAPFATFENSTALTLGTVSRLSVSGVNGAYTAPSGNEIGSPGIMNRAPFVALTIAAQAATANGAFNYTLPANTFADPENGGLTLTATLADGSSLPAWLTFDPATGTLSGTPSAVDLGRVVVRITAADNGTPARTSTLDLTVNVAPAAGSAFFPQSVASGDPRESSVVLWTRLMDGDTAVNRSVSLHLSTTGTLADVGTNGALGGTNLWTGGTLTAQSAHDGVVKVKVTGLNADTVYYYQFTYNGQRSPIGRTRTAPAAGSTRTVKYAAINCNDFVGRYFNVLKHLADQEADNIDFVLNLGDYIYETTGDPSFQTTSPGRAMVLSKPSEAINLGGGNYAAQSISNYRDIYKTIRQDRQLQRVHELFPMISIWDDHEFSDDNWKDNATYFDAKVNEQQTARKRNGEQAWMEFLPTERGLAATGNGLEVDASDLYPNTVIYDAFNFGGALDLITTDSRTERVDHLIPEEAFPASVPMDESATVATLAAAYGMPAATFASAVWPGIKSSFAPYVNIDDSAYAAVKAGLQAIVSAGASAELAALPAGQTPVTTGSAYATANVTGNLDASFVNSTFAAAGLSQPFDASALSAMPRGLSFFLLGKTSFFSDFGSRYQVVNQTFQLYAGYTYQAFLASNGALGRDQALFSSTQQTFLGTALATSAAAGRTWRVVASSTPYTPIKLELGDLPTGVSLPTQGTISGVTIPASIPSQFLAEFLLNADEPAGFPQYRQGILDLLAQHDAIIVSGDIHAQLIGNNGATNGQKVIDFTVPSAASSQFRRAVNSAFASVEALMTPSVRAATGLTGNFAFDTAQKDAVVNATDAIIKKNTTEMFDADTAAHGYTVFTAAPDAFLANFRKIDVSYIDDNLYSQSTAALDALFQRQQFTVTKTGTGANTDLTLGVPTTVTTSVEGNTGGTVSGGGTLVTGTQSTFTATPAPGYRLLSWKVNGTAAGSTNPLVTTVTAGMTVEATFTYQVQLLHFYAESGLLGTTTAPIMGAMIDRFDDQYANTLVIAEGDTFIPGPWLIAGADPSFNRLLHTGTFTSAADTTATAMGQADIAIMNAFGTAVSALGNHEFDLGSPVLAGAFFPANSSTVGNWVGAQFPFITANLDFAADSSLRARTDTTLGGTGGSIAGLEVSALAAKIAPYAIKTINGQKIGFVGATTWELLSKSSPNGTKPKDDANDSTSDLQEVASYLQGAVNALQALGVNKIIQVDQLDDLQRNKDLAGLVSGIDVVIAGGGHEYQKDANDVAGSYAGHTTPGSDAYPIVTAGADGKPMLIVTTDTEFSYLGRLVVDFDSNGELILSALDNGINGAYSSDESTLKAAYGTTNSASTIIAASTIGAKVKTITDAINGVITSKEGTIYGYTDVYLEGDRVFGRTQEVNLGNITADANIFKARSAFQSAGVSTGLNAIFSLKNGGGLRASIGAINASGAKVAPAAVPGIKPAGAVSLLDVENALRFDNKLMVFDATPQGLLNILNFAAGLSSGPSQQNGGYPQVGNIRFSYDPSRATGQKVRNAALYDDNGNLVSVIVRDGAVVDGAPSTIRCVALNFTANGGDSYPIKYLNPPTNTTVNNETSNFRFVLANGGLSNPVSRNLDFTAASTFTSLGLNASDILGEQKAFQDFMVARHNTTQTAYNQADTPASQDLRIQILSPSGRGTNDTVITPAYSLANSTFTATQADSSVLISINRSYGANAGSVTLRTDNGTASTVPPFAAAVAGTDYTDADGTVVSFSAGETTKTVSIALSPKTGATVPNRRFSVVLTASSDGVLGNPSTAEVQILAVDTVKPTLAITTPAANASISALSPYTIQGTAGDARGIDRVTVALNGAAAVEATLGSATVPTSVPWSLAIVPAIGANTVEVTAFDLNGNFTTVSRSFTFTQRFTLSLARTAPGGIALDTAGTVALAATPTTNATALAPITANSSPQLANVVPGTTVTLTATAKIGYAFINWSGLPNGATALGNVATFTMPANSVSVTAAFQANNVFAGEPGSAGSFYGLIRPNAGSSTRNGNVGFLTGTLSSTGAFTGRLLMDGLTHNFTASFFGDGSAVFTVAGVRENTITLGGRTLTLSYNVGAGNDAITASLTNGTETSSGVAHRAIYSATNLVPAALLNTASVANGPINRGAFTMAFPAKAQTPAIDTATYPQGDGWATLSLTDTGLVTGTLWLADGSIVTVSSALVSGNQCPIFAQLTTPGQAASVRGGSLLGTLVFDATQTDTDVAATDLTWIRPDVTGLTAGTTAAAINAANLYTAGWPTGIKVDAIGALYDKAKTIQAGIDLDGVSTDENGNTLTYEDGKLVFSSGKLSGAITKQNFIVAGNTVTKIPTTDMSFTLTATASTGAISGSFRPNWTPLATANPTFSGVILQKGAHKGGHGFFLSNATGDTDPESGDVNLTLEPLIGATAPVASTTPATVSATAPYTLSGTAGNARGVARVEVVLNGGDPVNAILGTPAADGTVAYNAVITPALGANTAVITVVDLRGNRTSTTVNFTFNQRFEIALSRTAPTGINLDDAGTVTMTASPATQATALAPTTANASPRTANVQHGTAITLTATPKAGYAFVRWTGLPMSATVTGNVASFSMPTSSLSITAEFATSASVFAGATGTGTGFFGLIRPAEGTATSNVTVGFLSGTLNAATGAFTGSVLADGVSQSVTATFYGNGEAIFGAGATRSASLSFGGRTLSLSLNTSGAKDQITATLTTAAGTSTGVAKRALYSATNAFASSGTYTVALPSKAQDPVVDTATYPQGDGYATLTATNSGGITLAVTLADNTIFSATTALVEGNEAPFFGQILTPGSTTAKGGSFSGTLKFDLTQADSDLTGTDLLWFRPAVTQQTGTTAAALATQLYTAGWPTGIKVDAVGARYLNTQTVQASLGLGAVNTTTGNAKLQFADGQLTAGITKTNFNINGSTVTKIPATDTSFTLTTTASTGAFTGTIRPNWTPTATALPAFKGIILQKGANQGGFGFFLSNIPGDLDPQSGGVSLGKP